MMTDNLSSPKPYASMSPDEKTAHIEHINAYISDTLPRIRAKGRSLNHKDIDDFHYGLRLIGAFPQYAVFSVRLMSVRADYDQYIASLEHQFKLLVEQLKQENTFRIPGGQQVIVLPQTQSLRRGRPTQAESEQRKREEQAAAHAEAMSRLTGAQISTTEAAPIAERESDTSRRQKSTERDLFDAAIEDAVSSPNDGQVESGASAAITPSSASDGVTASALPQLRDWYWLLPKPLVARMKALRDLRAEVTSESERAKLLFEQGASVDEMAPHTQRAKQLQNEISDIYADVDSYLATEYVMLTEVNPDWHGVVDEYESHQGGTRQQLIARLKHYADKLSNADDAWFDKTVAICRKKDAERIASET